MWTVNTSTLCGPGIDEWDVAFLDVDAYLDRIGHPRVPPSADGLRSLHEAHVRAIPFENVDVVLGTHPGLQLDRISDKLVRGRRGGYCYEHALLFAAVLEHLGYAVQRRIARVGRWTLSKRVADGWEALHAFDETPQRPIDYEVAHHYTSTHPRSPFTGQLIVMRLDHGVSRRLVGDELTVEYADGRFQRSTVAPGRLDATLRELDIVLDADELAALAARRPRTALA